jgi:hypothetical protein
VAGEAKRRRLALAATVQRGGGGWLYVKGQRDRQQAALARRQVEFARDVNEAFSKATTVYRVAGLRASVRHIPPHLSAQRISGNRLRSHRPPRASRGPPRAENRHAAFSGNSTTSVAYNRINIRNDELDAGRPHSHLYGHL